MAWWTSADPGVGEMADLGAVEGYVRLASDRAETLWTVLSAVNANITPDIWSGAGRDAWGEAFAREVVRFQPFAGRLLDAAAAMAAYREAVAAVAVAVDGAQQVIWDCTTAVGSVAWLRSSVGLGGGPMYLVDPFLPASAFEGGGTVAAPAWSGMGPVPVPAVVDSVADARAWATFLSERAAAATQEIARQAVARQGADDAFVAACEDVMSGWEDEIRLYQDAGITAPGEMTPLALARALGADPWGSGESLTFFFTRYGDDARVMSAFFLGMDPALVPYFLSQIGAKTFGAVHAPDVVDALAGASRHWTQESADAFMAGVFDTFDKDPTTHEWVYGLFTGPLLGQHAVTAAANEVDHREREGRSILAWERTQFRNAAQGPPAPADLAGAVLGQLGQYPHAVTAWFTGPEFDGDTGVVRNDRIDYWFDRRDWATWGNGGQAPAAMLKGILLTPGGPGDPDSSDPETWLQVCKLTTFAVEAMNENGSLRTENLSGAASVDFAHAAVLVLPFQVSGDGLGGGSNDQLDFIGHRPGPDGRPIPAMAERSLENLLALGSATDLGRAAIVAYRNEFETPPWSTDLDPIAYVRYIGTLDGAIAGAKGQAATQQAHAIDAHTQDKIDAFAAFASALPFGNAVESATSSVAREAGAIIQNLTVGDIITSGTEWASTWDTRYPWSTGHEAQADQEFRDGTRTGRDDIDETINTIIEEWRKQNPNLDSALLRQMRESGRTRWENTYELFH